MPVNRYATATTTGAAIAAALLLSACGTETPETIQYPASAPADERVADRNAGPDAASSQTPYESASRSESNTLPTYDGTLVSMVESAIAAEPELNTLGIDVSAVDGTIYLRGQARTRETRRLATEVASKVDGVKQVENELIVTAGAHSDERRVGDVAAIR